MAGHSRAAVGSAPPNPGACPCCGPRSPLIFELSPGQSRTFRVESRSTTAVGIARTAQALGGLGVIVGGTIWGTAALANAESDSSDSSARDAGKKTTLISGAVLIASIVWLAVTEGSWQEQ